MVYGQSPPRGCSSELRLALHIDQETLVSSYVRFRTSSLLTNLITTLFPKGEFLRTHRVGPLGLNGFLHLVLFFGIFHPYEPWPLFSGWVGGGWGVFLGQILTFFKVVWKLF